MNVSAEKNWCKAELNGKTGLVPKTYLKLRPNPWFKGKLGRISSEEILRKESRDGVFMVRESESTPGDFSISVVHNGLVKHLKVLRDEEGKFFIWDKKFPSLNQLVQFHKTSSVSRIEQIYLQVPQGILKVRALFNFTPQEEGELLLNTGDIVTVTDLSDKNWWTGECNGHSGMFPVSYVERLEWLCMYMYVCVHSYMTSKKWLMLLCNSLSSTSLRHWILNSGCSISFQVLTSNTTQCINMCLCMYGVVYTKTVSECVKHETLLISLMTHSNAWHVYICASCARGLCWLPSCWIICECMCVCNQNVCLHAYAYWSIDVHDKGVYCLHMICCHIGTPHYCRCENFHKKIFHGLKFQIFLCWTHYWNFNLAKNILGITKMTMGGSLAWIKPSRYHVYKDITAGHVFWSVKTHIHSSSRKSNGNNMHL